MAFTTTVVRAQWNIFGDADGVPNVGVYHGPDLDMDSPGSPVTASNTYRVYRTNEATGAVEVYVPGGGSNDFHSLDRGSLGGALAVGQGLGRGYLIVGKANFLLNHWTPAA